jgi:integrase
MQQSARPRRQAATAAGKRGYGEAIVGGWVDEQWQDDWRSAATEEGAPAKAARGSDEQRQERVTERRAAVQQAAAAAGTTRLTKEERNAELQAWMTENRNQNTAATYASGWNQFRKWVDTVSNPGSTGDAQMDAERPEEEDVARYMRYMVETKRSPMSSVAGALAAIADHLRTKRSATYDPCQGRIIDLMRSTLTARATMAGQKKELSWALLKRVLDAIGQAEGDETAGRDRCMILLSYFFFLRGSDVVRVRRRDISFSGTEQGRVMHLAVSPLCKNDKERKGHERLMGEREEGKVCMVEVMEEYLGATAGGAGEELLFRTVAGGPMHADTPRGRLRHWLRRAGVEDEMQYGFHSLRAGAATAAAKAGVAEEQIKQHGNWKSDAVRRYIRPDTEDRLKASDALGD